MNEQRRRIIIIAAVAAFVIIAALSAVLISPKSKVPPRATTVDYTDSITGELRTDLPNTTNQAERGEVHNDEPGLIAIAGIQDFYDDIGPTLAHSIDESIIAFVRAHGGPGINEASVVHAKITQSGSNPVTYSLELVTKRPEARYGGTITMQDSQAVAPVVQLKEEQ